jgi:chloride channel 3/4/5
VGGVLFSLEEVSYYFPLKTMLRSYFCALVAALTIKSINPLGNGKLVPFQVRYTSDWTPIEIFPFICLGLVGGALGAIIIKCIRKLFIFRQKLGIYKYPVTEVFFLALSTSSLGYLNYFSRSMGYNLFVSKLFTECSNSSVDFLCGY